MHQWIKIHGGAVLGTEMSSGWVAGLVPKKTLWIDGSIDISEEIA